MTNGARTRLAPVGTRGRHVLGADAAARAFAAERDACDRALESGDRVTTADLAIAGYVVRLRVAGQHLASLLLDAFLPAMTEPRRGAADLTIDIWDCSESAATPPGDALWDRTRSEDGRFFQDATARVLIWLDRLDQRMVARVTAASRLTPGDVYQPFGTLLALWLADRHTPAIHAGAVGRGGEVVVLTGHSGSGKSTTALSCLVAGFDYLGDDFIVLRQAADGCRVHAVYRTAHLESTHLRRFPALVGGVARPPADGEDKTVIRVDHLFTEQPCRDARVRAIVMPRIVPGGTTRLREAPKSAALLTMAPSSLLIRPSATPAAFAGLAALAEAVPTFWLELGADLSAIPVVLDTLLDSFRLSSSTVSSSTLHSLPHPSSSENEHV